MSSKNEIDTTLILLTPAETARRLSISLAQLEQRIDAADFPQPRRIGRSVRFVAGEVNAWAARLPASDKTAKWNQSSRVGGKTGDDWLIERKRSVEFNHQQRCRFAAVQPPVSHASAVRGSLLSLLSARVERPRRFVAGDPARLP